MKSFATASLLRFVAPVILLISAAHANAAMITPVPFATVNESVTKQSPGVWRYDFSFTNEGPSFFGEAEKLKIADYYIPFYADALVTSITAATNWTYTIEAGNVFGLKKADTLHYTANPGLGVAPGQTTGNFSFLAGYGAVKAPFIVTNGYGGMIGDPSIPGSPLAREDGLVEANAVPEPSSIALLLAGLGLAGVVANRKRQAS